MSDRQSFNSELDKVIALAGELGLVVESFTLDDQWHRVPIKGKKKDNLSGAYCLGEFSLKSGKVAIVGLLFNWASGQEERLTLDGIEGATPDEINEARQRARIAAEASKKAKAKLQDETALRAQSIWDKLPDAGRSVYLDRKKVKAWGLRFSRGSVVVPVRDELGKLWTLQWINAKGDKKFLTGGAKRGRFHFIKSALPLEEQAPLTIGVAEGYATAASLHEVLNFPIAVAFDAGNLSPVSEALRAVYPNARIVIFADRDVYNTHEQALIKTSSSTEDVRQLVQRLQSVHPDLLIDIVNDGDKRLKDTFNIGLTKALLAAAKVGGFVVSPYFADFSGQPKDFNDLFIQVGKEKMAGLIHRYISKYLACPQEEVIQANDLPAQLLEGENPISDSVPDSEQEPTFDPSKNDWRKLLEEGKTGFKASVRNTELVFRHDDGWKDALAYCELSYRVIKRRVLPMPNSEEGEWAEEDAAATRVWMSHQYGFTPSHADINDALIVVSRSNKFHPVREYLKGLKWDNTPRIDGWLKAAFSATDDERYLALAGSRVLIGAVARVMNPGCKFDNVMILEGIQGRGKSMVIRIMFGDWFSDSPLPIGDKEAYQLIQGKWGFELGELDSFNKAEVTALKQFFSQQIDRFRPSYGRYASDFKRQTVFWGSTNQDTYLRDYTGNRRFWPVYCPKVNKVWVAENRDQLWAEALFRYKAGEKWWFCQDTEEDQADYDIVTDVQDSRLQRDPWEDLLRPWLESSLQIDLTTAHILKECIGLDGAHMQQMHMNRLGPIMKSLGWRSKRKRIQSANGKTSQVRVWVSEELEERFKQVPL